MRYICCVNPSRRGIWWNAPIIYCSRAMAELCIIGKTVLPAGFSTTATSAISAATASPATSPPLGFGTGFIDRKIAPFHCKCIQFCDGLLGGFIGTHFYKSKSPRSPRIQITHYGRRLNASLLFEQLP
jgi:hypothetical protein